MTIKWLEPEDLTTAEFMIWLKWYLIDSMFLNEQAG